MSTDLSQAFGDSARGALSGILPPRNPRSPVRPEPAPEADDAEATPDADIAEERAADVPVRAAEPARGQAPAAAAPVAERSAPVVPRAARAKPPRQSRRQVQVPEAAPHSAGDDTSQVSVYLLPAAKSAVRRLRIDQGKLNAEIAFDALDAMSWRIRDLVQARQLAPRGEGSLFPARRTTRRARTLRQSGEPTRVLWTLQVTAAEQAVLDRLIAESGAEGISQLVSAALEAYLLEETDGQAGRG